MCQKGRHVNGGLDSSARTLWADPSQRILHIKEMRKTLNRVAAAIADDDRFFVVSCVSGKLKGYELASLSHSILRSRIKLFGCWIGPSTLWGGGKG